MRLAHRVFSTLMVLGFVSVVFADNIDELEKKIIEAGKNVKSFQAEMNMEQSMENEQMSMKNTGSGTTATMHNEDGQWLNRTEMKTKSVMKVAGNEQTHEAYTLTVSDGKFTYTLSDMMGQKSATKTKIDPRTTNMPSEEMFKQLRNTYELSARPDASVDGQAAYVVRAVPKQDDGMSGPTDYFYSKDWGVMLKMVSYTTENEPMMTMTMSNVKVNEKIDPSTFEFKAPAGVTVIDQSQE